MQAFWPSMRLLNRRAKFRRQLIYLALVSAFAAPVAAQTCPDLSTYYADSDPDWAAVEAQLALLMNQCLRSTDYFALRGAAQLNSGMIAESLDSLERALLLDPDNGAAQIDYAEALFQQGQLFSALALNEQILERSDLPSNLQPAIAARQETWQAMTQQLSFQADLLAGYDTNLNGAPDPDLITLTLSGEPVFLPLSEEFRPVSGPYLNPRLGMRYRQLAPDHQHNFSAEVRGRASEDQESDLVQLGARYAYVKPGTTGSWQVATGMSHLFFGGSALYSATEASGRYHWNRTAACRPFTTLATQHQLYHEQQRLNSLEAKVTAGLSCPRSGENSQQLWSLDVGWLHNEPLRSGRPGGVREGWQMNMDWQATWQGNTFRALVNHTQLDDRRGYSPLLAGGAARWLERSYVLLQYRRPLAWATQDASLLVNLYHQRQRSNIELFRTFDNTFEVGFSFRF